MAVPFASDAMHTVDPSQLPGDVLVREMAASQEEWTPACRFPVSSPCSWAAVIRLRAAVAWQPNSLLVPQPHLQYPLIISAIVPRPIGGCNVLLLCVPLHWMCSFCWICGAGLWQVDGCTAQPPATVGCLLSAAACSLAAICHASSAAHAAFVSTQSSSGVGNLAPFSYFNVMAHNPPHVCIGFAASRLRPHGRKDTLHNLLETGWAGVSSARAVGLVGRVGCAWLIRRVEGVQAAGQVVG